MRHAPGEGVELAVALLELGRLAHQLPLAPVHQAHGRAADERGERDAGERQPADEEVELALRRIERGERARDADAVERHQAPDVVGEVGVTLVDLRQRAAARRCRG